MMSQRTHRPRWILSISLLTVILAMTGLTGSRGTAAAGGAAIPALPEAAIAGVTELPPEAFSISWQLGAYLPQDGHPRLDAAMNSLATASKMSSLEALERAESLSLRLSGERVHAQIAVNASGLQSVREAVVKAGGEITGAGNQDTLMQGWLPIAALESLARHADVLQIRRPEEAVLLERSLAGASTTEGLAAMNGTAWHAGGHTGTGVKVGIIDGGFIGYPGLRGTDLPASVTVKNFVDGESDAQVDGTTEHGTACAEIIHDIAPGATLYLAKIGTNVDLEEAVAWLKNTHGVDVISVSMGWYNVVPGDGTGEFANLVASARSAGITWATAAGNDRERHWGGLYTDGDGDDFHEFNGIEINCLGPGGSSCYNINPGFPFRALLRWDDWTNVNQDYALILLRWNGSAWDIADVSNNPQNGSSGQRPTEFASFVTTGSATPYAVVIGRVSSSRRVNFELFVPRAPRLRELVTARSLANLADSPDAITVAALDVISPYPQESYSSEGPTNGPGGAATGGAIKPDISGFANVSTQSYGSGTSKFNGTSAATPHVAGAAALVQGAYPSYTPAQIESFLQGRAVDMGVAGKDARFGWGRLYLGAPPTSANTPPNKPSGPSPANSASGISTTPTLSWIGGDPDAGDTVTYDVYLDANDNTPGTLVCNDVNTRTCTPGPLAADTLHYWKVVATDNHGASATSLIWRFTTRSGTTPNPTVVYLPFILNNYPPPQPLPGTLYPTADATVLQGAANMNFGSTSDMWVGYDHCEPLEVGRSLIKFDVSKIPASTSITKATLRVYLTNSCDIGERTHTVNVYRTSGNWAETAVTWNSKPGQAEAYGSNSIRSKAWGWHSFDVTGLVRGWVKGSFANQGLVLRGPESSGTSSARLGFRTRNYSGTTYDPRILITYASGTSVAVPAEEQTACPTEDGPTVQDLFAGKLVAPENDAFTFATDTTCGAR